MTSTWLLMTVGDDARQRGGNAGYDDKPAVYYSWDSTVPNHAAIRPGAEVVFWDKRRLLGASVVESIDEEEADKVVYRCPECGMASFKPRKTKTPRYLCFECGATFDHPTRRLQRVTTYRSQHAAGWTDLDTSLSGDRLRRLCVSPRSQLSLRPLRADAFHEALASEGVDLQSTHFYRRLNRPEGERPQLVARLQTSPVERRLESGAELADCVCVISGPCPPNALTLSKLFLHGETGGSIARGELVLRRDLAVLMDCGDLAVHPERHVLDVSDHLARYPQYRALTDTPLTKPLTEAEQQWVATHWLVHRPA